MPLEIASFTLPSARLALSCNPPPSRIELCTNSSVGGLTPPLSDLQALVEPSPSPTPSASQGPPPPPPRPPIHIMIRPHARDFTYSPSEIETMVQDIEAFRQAGADGFVFGCLTRKSVPAASSPSTPSVPDNQATEQGTAKGGIDGTAKLHIDEEACRKLLAAAGPGKKCTFHRAFDLLPPKNMDAQLEVLISLGFRGVLTSGGNESSEGAVRGTRVLKRLVTQAKGRIEVIVGGGVRSVNVEKLRREIGAEWFHSSAVLKDQGVAEMANWEEVEALGKLIVGWDHS